MLNHWNNLINTDCVVVDIGEVTVYPIFRNGSTSLLDSCDRIHVNDQINDCENIEILIRNPDDRFISGINMYSEQNDLSVEETWSKARRGTLVDRHFCPQYIWLLHRYKFYKGTVILRKFEHIKALTSIHRKKSKIKKKQVPILNNFVSGDHRLMRLIDRPMDLKNLVERYKHVLS